MGGQGGSPREMEMGQQDFDISIDIGHGIAVVRPMGELDLVTAPTFRQSIESIDEKDIIVDFSAVEFMNSSGLSVLISATRKLRSTGGNLVIRNAQPMVRKTLSIAGVDELLTIE